MPGIPRDDLAYLGILVGSIFLGQLVKRLPSAAHRQFCVSFFGLLILLCICGWQTLHLVLTVLLNWLLIKISGPRLCHLLSFCWCFGYLAFFRCSHFLGLPRPLPHVNAVQLLATIKCIGLAFEIHDTNRRELELHKGDGKDNEAFRDIQPTFLGMLSYSFCYIGLLTGPYYKYRTFMDMLHCADASSIPTFDPVMRRISIAPLYVASFLLASQYFNAQNMLMEEFYSKHGFLYRLFYTVPVFFIFRMRFYIAWVLAECMCISATLGAYPASSKPQPGLGPSTDPEAAKAAKMENNMHVATMPSPPRCIVYDFETIHNVDELGCEWNPRVQDGMRSWNMTVQYWLYEFVYRRLPKSSRTVITMLVSAFWHGIYPGYYVSLLTAAFCVRADRALVRIFTPDPTSSPSPSQRTSRQTRPVSNSDTQSPSKLLPWLRWLYKMRCYEYMSVGFIHLTYEATVGYWTSVYFFIHLLSISFILVANLVSLVRR